MRQQQQLQLKQDMSISQILREYGIRFTSISAQILLAVTTFTLCRFATCSIVLTFEHKRLSGTKLSFFNEDRKLPGRSEPDDFPPTYMIY